MGLRIFPALKVGDVWFNQNRGEGEQESGKRNQKASRKNFIIQNSEFSFSQKSDHRREGKLGRRSGMRSRSGEYEGS